MDGGELKRRFGRRIQVLREAKGLTQEQLAAQIGRSVDTVGNIERGINATRIETAYLLAVRLGVPLAALFHLDEPGSGGTAELQPGLEPILALLRDVEADTLAQMTALIEAGLKLARRA